MVDHQVKFVCRVSRFSGLIDTGSQCAVLDKDMLGELGNAATGHCIFWVIYFYFLCFLGVAERVRCIYFV